MNRLARRRLVWALKSRDDADRWRAATALSQVDDPPTLRRLERLLEGRGREEGRAAAAYVLGFSGTGEVADVLARRLADPEESVLVRAHAAEALGHLLQHEPVLARIRTTIAAGLRDPAAEVRFWSAFAAGVLGLQESRPQLGRLAHDETAVEGWWTVGQEAEWALRCLNGEDDPPLPERVSLPGEPESGAGPGNAADPPPDMAGV
jgi:HEAT repeat protein